MIALQWVSYQSSFDFAGCNLNTDIFKGFEANKGFVVAVTVRNTVYEYSKIQSQQQMVLLSHWYLSLENDKTFVVYFQVYHAANGTMFVDLSLIYFLELLTMMTP